MVMTETRPRLPVTMDDITADYLTGMLQDYAPGVSISRIEQTDVWHGFTTVMRYRIEVNDVGKEAGLGPTIIVKCGLEKHSPSRSRTYAMEALAYRNILPELGLKIPKTYFSDVEPAQRQTLLLMEDMTARGVTFGHYAETHSLEQAKKYIIALADFHARTWESPDIKPGGRWESKGRFEYGKGQWFGVPNNGIAMLTDYLREFGFLKPEHWATCLAQPRCAAVSKYLLDPEWAELAVIVAANVGQRAPKCIIHGDTHLGNLYWEPDGAAAFFDPAPRIEAGYSEIIYYLINCLDPMDRRRHEHDLTRLYISELKRRGVTPPEFDDMWRQMCLMSAYGHMVFVINKPVDFSGAYQTEEFNIAHTMRYSTFLMDHNVRELVLDVVKQDAGLGDPKNFAFKPQS